MHEIKCASALEFNVNSYTAVVHLNSLPANWNDLVSFQKSKRSTILISLPSLMQPVCFLYLINVMLRILVLLFTTTVSAADDSYIVMPFAIWRMRHVYRATSQPGNGKPFSQALNMVGGVWEGGTATCPENVWILLLKMEHFGVLNTPFLLQTKLSVLLSKSGPLAAPPSPRNSRICWKIVEQ